MLSLTTARRDELLQVYGKDPDPEHRSRAHLILLLAGGLYLGHHRGHALL